MPKEKELKCRICGEWVVESQLQTHVDMHKAETDTLTIKSVFGVR